MSFTDYILQLIWKKDEDWATRTKNYIQRSLEAAKINILAIVGYPSHNDVQIFKICSFSLIGILTVVMILRVFLSLRSSCSKPIECSCKRSYIFSVFALLRTFFYAILLLTIIISVPWEYVRLYQSEVSRKASITIKGMPDECQPNKWSLFDSLRFWLYKQFSWSGDNCEEYHKATLVDPFWEITPLQVMSSLCARTASFFIETLFVNLGVSLRGFFTNIPVQWQPIILLLNSVLIIIFMIMTCRYKIKAPLFFSLEPGTKYDCCSINYKKDEKVGHHRLAIDKGSPVQH